MSLETLEEMLEKLEVVVNERRKKKARLLLKLKSALVNCSNMRNADR